jgi:hypothetical protein
MYSLSAPQNREGGAQEGEPFCEGDTVVRLMVSNKRYKKPQFPARAMDTWLCQFSLFSIRLVIQNSPRRPYRVMCVG